MLPALTAARVRFTQWSRHSLLLLRIEAGQSTAVRIELTDEDEPSPEQQFPGFVRVCGQRPALVPE